jgi:hypothetical protein
MRTCLALFIVGLMLSFQPNEEWTTVSAADRADPSTSLDTPVPANFIVANSLTDVVIEMLQGSHTFRKQCRHLGSVRALEVRVSLDPKWDPISRREGRAKCIIRRYQYGRIEADVRLLTAIDMQTHIAHELEHVREYVEGINYLVTSIQFPSRVWITFEGHFESARAIEAGDQVTSEILRHRSRPRTATLARRAP